MNNKPLKIIRNAVQVEMPESTKLVLWYYKVNLKDGQVVGVERASDFPPETTEENTSLLTFQQLGIAIHVTWLPEKPDPASELRYKGYLAITEDLASLLPPDLQKKFKKAVFGFGHPEGATVEWHTRTDD